MVAIKQINEYNGYIHTRSAIAPGNPKIGDTWDEVVSGKIRAWVWNGVLWLSVQDFSFGLSSGNGNMTTSGNGNIIAVPMDFDADVFATTLIIGGGVTTAFSPGGAVDSAANYYNFGLQRSFSGSSTADVGTRWSFQNTTYAASNSFLIYHPVNTLISLVGANGSTTANRGIRSTWSKLGATAITLINVSTALIYKIARR
jgi:hypothetical protein